ncbi:hypothetical protein DL769_008329 [Monosporascus sp. CRB-8-3]|nr:hypothetical protein DL769_008329 [Monosporascus sp. CRB-8-3]
MFDVLWTDPNRELLKDKIRKREQEGKSKGKVTKRPQINRRPLSTHSSSSSDRGFGLFTKARKTLTTSSKPKNPTTSPDLCTEEVPRAGRTSAYGVKSLLPHPDRSEVTVKAVTGSLLPVQPHDFSDVASGASSRDSVLSRGTAHKSAPITDTWADEIAEGDSPVTTKSEYLFQSLGPSSFITKATEVTFSPRIPDTDLDQLISEIHISAEGTRSATPPISGSGDGSASRDSAPCPSTDALVRTPMTIEGTEFLMPPSHLPLTPSSTKTRKSRIAHVLDWNVDDSAANPEAWKPPHEWGCTPTKRARSASPEDRQQISSASPEIDHYMSPDILTLQREVRMMEMASPEIILGNIEADIDEASDNASDTMIYKQHEMAKKRWMFWALHYMGSYAEFETLHRHSHHASSSRAPRILALYETPASASFLAALYPGVALSHLSPTPISPDLFPNVQPILVPTISTSAAFRALPPQFYSTITCLSMPALFPSTEIPPFLRRIHRCLAPGGALHLTVIDPQPVSSSTGPILRQWLFEKLLINLERHFRTTYPSGTFPDWLEIGKLRGEGSTITTLSAPVVDNRVTSPGEAKDASTVKAELRFEAVKKLWQEVWGHFVRADRWWWDDEDIMQECREYGTTWKYSHIVAVKED